ncbi:MAG TPA: glutamyl-tRNA reductase [Bacteroidia bacterium]|jgi:glutamyl-tRNA reductase|nr:glutamyl-tRNA reductase [Bacteroidia bacterium]
MNLNAFYTIAITHKNFDIKELGRLHIDGKDEKTVLTKLKNKLHLEELIFLSTCNRVEILFTTKKNIDKTFLTDLFSLLTKSLKATELKKLVASAQIFHSHEAVNHILRVASSLESVVVGEREIITQFRQAYEKCNQSGLTGDFMRLLNKHTVETAKRVFTETDIAKNPVSVVSLAYRLLRDKAVKENARCIIVGAGQTNTNLAKYLKKHQFSTFTVFNRSLDKAEELAKELGGKAFALSQLKNYKKGFDVLVTCTGAKNPVITPQIFETLLQNDKDKKIIIDLAVPTDLQAQVLKKFKIDYISVSAIKEQAKQNLSLRKKEIKNCEAIIYTKTIEFEGILKERSIELAFREIPKKIKEINQLALTEVFAKDMQTLDAGSKETIDKIIGYIEKKYNAVAITTAKKVFLSASYE